MAMEYLNEVMTTIRPWLHARLRTGRMVTSDGAELAIYYAVNPQEKAALTFVHGFCEFNGKYHELLYKFWNAGYSVFFFEQRGYGKSTRLIEDKHKVYIDTFDTHVKDLKEFQEKVVDVYALTKRRALFSHSMGGCVAALFLEEYPDVFEVSLMSSPMLQMNFGPLPDLSVPVVKRGTEMINLRTEFGPNQGPFTGIPDFEHSSCTEEGRYRYQFAQRQNDEDYQTNGATWQWIRAGHDACTKALENADKIEIPTLLMQAGLDTMVKPDGQLRFARRAKNVLIVHFPQSRHELFNGPDATRNIYYDTMFDFLKRNMK